MNKTTSSFFEAYPNLMRAAKDPLEDLRELEYERAEERLRSQFKMEKIVYSQDSLYSHQLEAAKSTPESSDKIWKRGSKVINADVREMAHHLKAYFTVRRLCTCLLVYLSILSLCLIVFIYI